MIKRQQNLGILDEQTDSLGNLMIEQLPDGRIKYIMSDYLTRFLMDKVKQPFEKRDLLKKYFML